MTERQEDDHAKKVQDWMKKNAQGLSLVQTAKLMQEAIEAIEKRSLMILSKVTLSVILDRVLHQGQEKFPILLSVKLNDESLISFVDIKEDEKSQDFIKALQYILINLLEVLARITANILSVPLHQELKKVTWNPEIP